MMFVLFVLLLQSTAGTSAAPPLPYYARHVTCWCEKCAEQDEAAHWTAARDLPAYGRQGVPSTKSFAVAAGEKVTVLDGVVVVDRADRIRVLQRLTLVDVPVGFVVGDVFWRVQVSGEGNATIWHDGRMFETVVDGRSVCAKRGPGCSGVIEEQGSRQWWLKIRNDRGQIGWVRADWNFIDDSCGVPRGR